MFVGVGTSILAALAGMGYWSLIILQTVSGVVYAIGAWICEPWRPGPPRRGTEVRSMARFGGYLTGVSLLTYVFRNADNVLIGWRWGAGALGFYQKAYSLLMLPVNQVNSPIEVVAVSTLSRVTSDAARQRRYFLAATRSRLPSPCRSWLSRRFSPVTSSPFYWETSGPPRFVSFNF